MSKKNNISEEELDGALNAFFLNTHSKEEDEKTAKIVFEQKYDAMVDSEKERRLLAKLAGGNRGRNILWSLLALLLLSAGVYFFSGQKQASVPAATAPEKPEITNTASPAIAQNTSSTPSIGQHVAMPRVEMDKFTPPPAVSEDQPLGYTEPPPPQEAPAETAPEVKTPAASTPSNPMELPLFNKAGLAYFAKVKEQMINKIIKIDDKLYAKTEPGATMYKSREVLVSPYVMSQHPVTNLQYKTFLADLAMQGRVNDLKKCLPKVDVWKDYGCFALAKNYFESEAYNDFPVVNIGKEATEIYCEWLETEVNAKFDEMGGEPGPDKFGSSGGYKAKAPSRKKGVTVRLPYDYEWIYSCESAFALCPDCGTGYNTIYDPSEGLVDKGFVKRNSVISKKGKRKLNRMDALQDINRYGMTEVEMLSIFKEAMNFEPIKNATDPASYPGNIESCTTAGHVCEIIKQQDGGMTVRGCCWKDKAEYQTMMDAFKKNDASPFVGFRVEILPTEKGTDRNPFW